LAADNANTTANTASTNATSAQNIAANALTVADGLDQSGLAFGQLYNNTSGAAGSKVIDLGDLTSSVGNSHFTNENQGVDKYTCSEGTGVFSLGSV